MVVLASIVGILFGAFAFILIEPLCILFGATDNILPYALRYGRIIAIGFPFVILPAYGVAHFHRLSFANTVC